MDPLRRIPIGRKVALARQLRREPTPAERHAWSLLRNRKVLGLKFRRQHVLHGFIVDFYCAQRKLVIELEGNPHDDARQAAYDVARAAWLEAAGYRVIHLRNRDVSQAHLEDVLAHQLRHPRAPLSPPSPGGRGGQGVRPNNGGMAQGQRQPTLRSSQRPSTRVSQDTARA